MSDNKSPKNLQKTLIIVSSLVALVGVSIIPFLSNLNRPSSPNSISSPSENNNNSAQNEQLTKIAQGYESVLEREPENRVALQGLVEARASMNDFAGAKEPMEKLVALEPENPIYLQTLAQINLQLNDIDGALQPLKKLAKIYPDRTEITTIIDTLEKAQRGELPEQQPSPIAPATPLTPDPSIPIPIPSPQN